MYLTKRQKEILTFIKDYRESFGYAPTFQEIASHFKFSSKGTVYKHIKNLMEKGFIHHEWNRNRAIVVKEEKPFMTELPLLGYVQAGQPIEAVTQKDSISVPPDMLRSGLHYVLQVKGDSMIDEQIRDGDFVIVQERPVADNGDVVIALVDGTEVTVKKFYRENGYIRLQPSNPNMEPIILNSERVTIQGVVVGILRKFS
jgi:repressor LexA